MDQITAILYEIELEIKKIGYRKVKNQAITRILLSSNKYRKKNCIQLSVSIF